MLIQKNAPAIVMLGVLLALKLSQDEGDDELLRRLHAREPDAMKSVYDRYGRIAWSVILSIVKDAAVAEDLVQETFLRVWNRAHTFEPGRGAIGPWLLTIARNQAIDHIRGRSARMGRSQEVDAGDCPALYANMEDEILNAENARLVRAAISKLDANQRKVIELAYYEGLSQSQMAERMGQPLGTVKTWARARLREDLGEVAVA
jgi:RNA polymerase sigma-70 factor, ECF subfamily